MLGVAFMAGTLVLTDTISKTFDDLFTEAYDGTDAVVRAEARFEDPNGASAPSGAASTPSLVTVVAASTGGVAEGDVWGYAQLVDTDGDAGRRSRDGRAHPRRQLERARRAEPFTLVDGRGPGADDEVVIDRKSAETAGYGGG